MSRVVYLCLAAVLLAAVCVSAYSYERRESLDEAEDNDMYMEGIDDEMDDMRMDPAREDMSRHGRPYHISPMTKARRTPLTTRNLTTVFMRALDTKNALLLMMMVDAKTLIAYSSELPAGGLYKGRRGLLELGEACLKTVRVTNSSYKIVNVDEDRNTATVVRSFSGVARKTGNSFSARTMFVIKFALQRVACIDIVDLDYDVMKAAIATKAEKALCKLTETWFENGKESPKLWDLVADNVSVVFGAVSPKTLFSANGKQTIINHVKAHVNEKTDSCKLLECMHNHTDESTVLHADDNRVVMINFAGNMIRSAKLIDRFSEGTILHGITRVDDDAKNSVLVYFTLHEFDNDGKLTRAYIQLARPLTVLDRVHLRDVHHITIGVGGQ